MSVKAGKPDYPVHDYITTRWSPYAYDPDKPVSAADLRALFEAARWAPSSYNEQPWRYLVATKDQPEEFEKLLGCLVEGNQQWAQHAPVLVLTVAKLTFTRNGKPNGAAIHDMGLASATLTFEATHRGLYVHQMIGIVPEKARESYNIPEGYQPLTAIAIGYPADPKKAPESLAERDQAPRDRMKLPEFVYGSDWEKAATVVAE